MNLQTALPSLPWWRVPTMWLVVGGPAAVVVAGFTTLGIAIIGGDVPLRVNVSTPADALAPATQARNHANVPQPAPAAAR
jgi:hypothetical protein